MRTIACIEPHCNNTRVVYASYATVKRCEPCQKKHRRALERKRMAERGVTWYDERKRTRQRRRAEGRLCVYILEWDPQGKLRVGYEFTKAEALRLPEGAVFKKRYDYRYQGAYRVEAGRLRRVAGGA